MAPTNNGDRAFLPPIPPIIRKRITSNYGIYVPETGSFWEWCASIDVPRIITEGGKKGLCALSLGYITIALYGCTCGAINKDKHGNKIEPLLIPDLQRFASEDTKWLFAFDRDEKQTAKIAVSSGKKKLRAALDAANCHYIDIIWKENDVKGLDDLVMQEGSGAFNSAYAIAIAKLEKQFNSTHLRSKQANKIPEADILAADIASHYLLKLLWNDEHKTWMVFSHKIDGIWAPVTDHFIETLIQTTLESKGIKGYGTDSYITNIRKFLSRRLVTFSWVEREGILPFEDGVVDIVTGKERKSFTRK